MSYEKDNNTHLDKSDTPNVPTDKYNNKEIERLTGFAEMRNVSDVRSIREQVKGRVSDILAAVEKSTNSANLLQLEKSLSSAYSLSRYRREWFLTKVPITYKQRSFQ